MYSRDAIRPTHTEHLMYPESCRHEHWVARSPLLESHLRTPVFLRTLRTTAMLVVYRHFSTTTTARPYGCKRCIRLVGLARAVPGSSHGLPGHHDKACRVLMFPGLGNFVLCSQMCTVNILAIHLAMLPPRGQLNAEMSRSCHRYIQSV